MELKINERFIPIKDLRITCRHSTLGDTSTRERSTQMDQNTYSPELQALLDLQDTQKETASTLMAQVVELQASLNVLMDLQKLTLVSSEQFEQAELDEYCKTQMDKYRRQCLELVKQNMEVAKKMFEDNVGKVM
jgi:hypothetical protein